MSRVGPDERARLHEAASVLAGIRAATTLLNPPEEIGGSDRFGRIDEKRRAAMAAMVQSELERLERMVRREQDAARPAIPGPRTGELEAEVIDLDAVVATMVLAHEAKGTVVAWRPSRMLALGDADQLTEALNVLLDNAAAHGSGSVRIEVGAAASANPAVEIAVTDDGPGVAPELCRRIFAWGVSRPGSTGQGIGLHAARDLMERQGGYLELDVIGEHTTFVLGIPMLGCAEDGAADVARDGADELSARGGRRGVAA